MKIKEFGRLPESPPPPDPPLTALRSRYLNTAAIDRHICRSSSLNHSLRKILFNMFS